jgi:hypothetical protein
LSVRPERDYSQPPQPTLRAGEKTQASGDEKEIAGNGEHPADPNDR